MVLVSVYDWKVRIHQNESLNDKKLDERDACPHQLWNLGHENRIELLGTDILTLPPPCS